MLFRVLFLALLLAIPAAWAKPLRLVQWTDIHAGGSHFNATAFDEAFQKGLATNPEAILLTGDHCDNSFDQAGFQARFRKAAELIASRVRGYPGPLIFALGNDDFVHNYHTETEYLQATYRDMREVFGSRYYLNELGNGVSPERPGGLVWLSLNSQIFSNLNKYAKAPVQADQSFTWLRDQLRALAASGDEPTVVLLTHIPPTYDLYFQAPAWKEEHMARLVGLLREYPGQVLMVCGHYHRNHVQAIEHPRKPIPVFTSGALATKFGYWSNWRQYRWTLGADDQVEAVDYTIHYPGKPAWSSSYRVVPVEIARFFDAVLGSEALFNRYFADVYGHHPDYRERAKQLKDALREEFWIR